MSIVLDVKDDTLRRNPRTYRVRRVWATDSMGKGWEYLLEASFPPKMRRTILDRLLGRPGNLEPVRWYRCQIADTEEKARAYIATMEDRLRHDGTTVYTTVVP